MTDIYAQHDAAFANVSAFVILKNGERVATVAIKRGAAVTAYVHLIGVPMTKGRASGGGYDRASAAVSEAVRKITPMEPEADYMSARELAFTANRTAMLNARQDMDSRDWTDALRRAGFSVLQAV